MGYTTKFTGTLYFTEPITIDQLNYLETIFNEDCRDHPEWEAPGLYYIDLDFNGEENGLIWNGAEKTYFMDKLVNVVIRLMRKHWPAFGLIGTMTAQGEDVNDRWKLIIDENGFAKHVIL
jgi:hypothetical protein